MSADIILLVVQVIAAAGVVISVVYLGVQIHQQNEITRASFGHSLTQRLYDRYFQTTKDAEFSEFLSQDWAREDLSNTETWRITHFIIMCLVDLFDVYDKVKQGYVEKKHLDIRMTPLKMGVMKSSIGKGVWKYMKVNRDDEFIQWFEHQIYETELVIDENIKKRNISQNMYR